MLVGGMIFIWDLGKPHFYYNPTPSISSAVEAERDVLNGDKDICVT